MLLQCSGRAVTFFVSDFHLPKVRSFKYFFLQFVLCVTKWSWKSSESKHTRFPDFQFLESVIEPDSEQILLFASGSELIFKLH